MDPLKWLKIMTFLGSDTVKSTGSNKEGDKKIETIKKLLEIFQENPLVNQSSSSPEPEKKEKQPKNNSTTTSTLSSSNNTTTNSNRDIKIGQSALPTLKELDAKFSVFPFSKKIHGEIKWLGKSSLLQDLVNSSTPVISPIFKECGYNWRIILTTAVINEHRGYVKYVVANVISEDCKHEPNLSIKVDLNIGLYNFKKETLSNTSHSLAVSNGWSVNNQMVTTLNPIIKNSSLISTYHSLVYSLYFIPQFRKILLSIPFVAGTTQTQTITFQLQKIFHMLIHNKSITEDTLKEAINHFSFFYHCNPLDFKRLIHEIFIQVYEKSKSSSDVEKLFSIHPSGKKENFDPVLSITSPHSGDLVSLLKSEFTKMKGVRFPPVLHVSFGDVTKVHKHLTVENYFSVLPQIIPPEHFFVYDFKPGLSRSSHTHYLLYCIWVQEFNEPDVKDTYSFIRPLNQPHWLKIKNGEVEEVSYKYIQTRFNEINFEVPILSKFAKSQNLKMKMESPFMLVYILESEIHSLFGDEYDKFTVPLDQNILKSNKDAFIKFQELMPDGKNEGGATTTTITLPTTSTQAKPTTETNSNTPKKVPSPNLSSQPNNRSNTPPTTPPTTTTTNNNNNNEKLLAEKVQVEKLLEEKKVVEKSLLAKVEGITSEKKALENKLEETKQQFQIRIKHLETQLSNLNSNVNDNEKKYEITLQQQKKDNEKYQTLVKDSESTIYDLRKQLSEEKRNNAEYQNQLKKEVSGMKIFSENQRKQIEKLKAEIAGLRVEKQQQELESINAKKEVLIVKTELENLIQVKLGLEKLVEELKQKIEMSGTIALPDGDKIKSMDYQQLVNFQLLLTKKLNKVNKSINNRNSCIVCMDKIRQITFAPCGHYVTCSGCSAALTICPMLKSCVGVEVTSVQTDQYGFVNDRRFMLVHDGRFMTQRTTIEMGNIFPTFSDDGKFLIVKTRDPNVEPLRVATTLPEDAPIVEVVIWRDTVKVLDCGDEASKFFSQVVGKENVRLVKVAPEDIYKRPLEEPLAKLARDQNTTDDHVYEHAFCDGSQIMILSQESIDNLNSKSEALRKKNGEEPQLKYTERNFRPNILIAGANPDEEDTWKNIRIGNYTLKCLSGTPRCKFTTINPDVPQINSYGHDEPLRTLRTYKAQGKDVMFGVFTVHNGGCSDISVGDIVEGFTY
eukprot:gene11286-13821_t